MDEKSVREIALFFFFCLLDENKAFELASIAADEFQELKKEHINEKSTVLVVRATSKYWKKFGLKFPKGRPRINQGLGWIVPVELKLGPWMDFQKNSSDEDLLTLVWSLILKYSDEDIAKALGSSPGTISYRVGNAVKKLADYL